MKRNRRIKKYKYHKRPRHRKRRTQNLNKINPLPILLVMALISFLVLSITKSHSVPYDKLANFYLNNDTITHIEKYCENNRRDPFPYLAFYLDILQYDARDYSKEDVSQFLNNIKWYNKVNINKRYNKGAQIIEKAIGDVACFPVKASDIEYTFEDTYGAARTYGGNRTHLGTDIMDVDNERGRLEIISMTDGVIANLGWNEKGGWRIGINTPTGTYFYYAHLESYEEGLFEGMKIKAGDTLGFMGDSGYGEEPGTVGMFPVHLHLGIMLRDVTKEEYWINPYYILKYTEQKYQ